MKCKLAQCRNCQSHKFCGAVNWEHTALCCCQHFNTDKFSFFPSFFLSNPVELHREMTSPPNLPNNTPRLPHNAISPKSCCLHIVAMPPHTPHPSVMPHAALLHTTPPPIVVHISTGAHSTLLSLFNELSFFFFPFYFSNCSNFKLPTHYYHTMLHVMQHHPRPCSAMQACHPYHCSIQVPTPSLPCHPAMLHHTTHIPHPTLPPVARGPILTSLTG